MGFTFSVPIPYSHILICYSTHTKQGREIKSHPRPILSPQWIIFFNNSKIIFKPNHNVVMHYISSKEMMAINDYGEGEERGRESEIWK